MRTSRASTMMATLIGAAILMASCGSTPSTESVVTTKPSDPLGPADVLEAMIDVLEDGDFAGTRSYVDNDQLALLTFIDGTAPERVAQMVQGNIPRDVLVSFWGTFSESVADMSGQSIGRLEVGEPKPLGDDGEFVLIDTTIGASGNVSPWVVRFTNQGWKVDLLATFGGALAPNLWEWTESLSEGEARSIVFEAVADNRASLAVARQLGEDWLPEVAIEALRELEDR